MKAATIRGNDSRAGDKPKYGAGREKLDTIVSLFTDEGVGAANGILKYFSWPEAKIVQVVGL
jgi:hypothetical protein